MLRTVYAPVAAIVAIFALTMGCNFVGPNRRNDPELAHYKEIAARYDYPEVDATPSMQYATSEAPRTITENSIPQEWWNLSLDESIQLAVTQSAVLRDLGGTVVRAPDSARTILGPAIVSADPRFGMEAALAAFDATIGSSVSAEKNDRMVNNFVASGGSRFFRQDLLVAQSQVSKVTTSGTQLTLRGTTTYDFNNASFNRFPSTWDSAIEVEARHPLLQGAGTRFNRIAGPNAVPGVYNGVVIARVNTDISVADFELGIRDLVSNVENAYWDLYFAYRDLDAKITARNTALETWQRINAMYQTGQPGGTAEREAQAREQYYRFEEEVQNALSGRLQDSTNTNNGSGGGSFRGIGGVLVCERRLRLACGLPITDGRMIRPADEPTLARVTFDWGGVTGDAIIRRPELHRQRLAIKRRELELIASRNFLLPRLDATSRYRWRGLGNGLLGDADVPFDPADPQGYFNNSSIDNLFIGDFAEWQVGAELVMPIGFRRGYAAVRNAQLLLARERAVLCEQERQIVHDLSNALADLSRAYQVMNTSFNRRAAAQRQVDILRDKLSKDLPVNLDQLLDAERRLSDADIQYYRALVEHSIAIKNVHFEKGTLLEYCHVQMAERLPPAELAQNELRPPQSHLAPEQSPEIPVPEPDPNEVEPAPAEVVADPAFGPPSVPADEPVVPAVPEYVPQTVMTPQESLPLPGQTLPNTVDLNPEGPDLAGDSKWSDPSQLYATPTPAPRGQTPPTEADNSRGPQLGGVRRPSGPAAMSLAPPAPRAATEPTPARQPMPPEFSSPENGPTYTYEYPQAPEGSVPTLPSGQPSAQQPQAQLGNVRRPSGAARMNLLPPSTVAQPTPSSSQLPLQGAGEPTLAGPQSAPEMSQPYENASPAATLPPATTRQPQLGNVRRPSGAAAINLMPPRAQAPAAPAQPTLTAPQQQQQPLVTQQPVAPPPPAVGNQLQSELSFPLPGQAVPSQPQAQNVPAPQPSPTQPQSPPAAMSSQRRRPSAPQFVQPSQQQPAPSQPTNVPTNVPPTGPANMQYAAPPMAAPSMNAPQMAAPQIAAPQPTQPRTPQLEARRRASSAATMNLQPAATSQPTPAANASMSLEPAMNAPPATQYPNQQQFELPRTQQPAFQQPQPAAPQFEQPQFQQPQYQPPQVQQPAQPQYEEPAWEQPTYDQLPPLQSTVRPYSTAPQAPATNYAPPPPAQPVFAPAPAMPSYPPRQPSLDQIRRASPAAPFNSQLPQQPTPAVGPLPNQSGQLIPATIESRPSSRLIEQTWFAPGANSASGPPMPRSAIAPVSATSPAINYLPAVE